MKIKKALILFLSLCMTGAFSGCVSTTPAPAEVQEKPDNTFSFVELMIGDTDIEEWHENNVITRVKWQKLRLSDGHSKTYPALSAAFDKYNAENLTEAKALMYEFIPLAEEMEGEEYNPVYCQAEAETYLQRADNHIISLLECIEQYTGGIHPDYFWNGINFSADTGEKLLLTDVLTNLEDLPAVLEKKITEKYSDVVFYELEDTFSKYKPEEFTWTLDYQGITFWFSPYEIAAYTVGTLSAKLWFDEFPDMFNKKYLKTPETYAISLPVGLDVDFDLVSEDGKKDSVFTEKVLDDYGSYYMFSTVIEGQTYTDEINYAYDFDVYLVHTGDKNYIYSDSISDNDYRMLCAIDINDGSLRQIEELYSTGFYSEFIEEGFETGTVYKQAINNPEKLKLQTRFEILGTRGGVAGFKTDATNGKLKMTDDAYTFTYGHEVKNQIPLEAKILPDMEKTEIPEGTTLLPYQTDGKTYVDVKTENGQILRLTIDVSDWPRTVNGIPEDECFENLLYAG